MYPYSYYPRVNDAKPRYDKYDSAKNLPLFINDIKNLNLRIEYLSEIMKKSFPNSQGWDEDLTAIKEKIKLILKVVDPKEKQDYLLRLNKIKENDLACSKKFENLKIPAERYNYYYGNENSYWFKFATFFSGREQADIENRIKSLKMLSSQLGYSYKDDWRDINENEIFEEVRKKLVHKYEKLNALGGTGFYYIDKLEGLLRKFIQRTEAFLPEISIISELKKSLEKDDSRLAKFNKLKDEWLETLKLDMELKMEVTTQYLSLDFYNESVKLEKELDKLKPYFMKCKMNDVSPGNLCSLEKEKRQKYLEEYLKQVEKFDGKCKEFEKLKNSIKALETYRMNWEIERAEERDFSLFYSSKEKIDLKKSTATIIESYKTTIKQIEDKRSNFLSKINEVQDKINELKNPKPKDNSIDNKNLK
jgi:hypothetical protein